MARVSQMSDTPGFSMHDVGTLSIDVFDQNTDNPDTSVQSS